MQPKISYFVHCKKLTGEYEMTDFDPLWVPLLTHYDSSDQQGLDHARTSKHIKSISANVRQYLIAGTTGDGWEMSDLLLRDWITFVQSANTLTPQHRLLFGAFATTTEKVIERAKSIESQIASKPIIASYAGITICPPVNPNATQDMVFEHFRRIIAATTSQLAIYQLPQIVGCEIEPQTFIKILESSSRVSMFKDTSGADRVARSGLEVGSTLMLRGAEGNYSKELKPNGTYDGWLLSTANVFSPELRYIAENACGDETEKATACSQNLSNLVEKLFQISEGLPEGNPFSNINRAVDHIFAYGSDWRAKPARLASGNRLPQIFLSRVNDILSVSGYNTTKGYL